MCTSAETSAPHVCSCRYSIDGDRQCKNKHLASTEIATEARKLTQMPTKVLVRSYTRKSPIRMPTQVLVRLYTKIETAFSVDVYVLPKATEHIPLCLAATPTNSMV